jgi:chemotaxis protein histidine kinase CheA
MLDMAQKQQNINAVLPTLVVGVEDEYFAIPHSDVREIVMIVENGPQNIEFRNNILVTRLRDGNLPRSISNHREK